MRVRRGTGCSTCTAAALQLQLGSPLASEAWLELPVFRLGALGLVASSHLALLCVHHEWILIRYSRRFWKTRGVWWGGGVVG